MKVEIFYTPGCSACEAAHAKLRMAAQDAVKNLDWRELNVLENLDYAVELGVITLPSIIVDGELVFTSMPTATQLREALIERKGTRA
jgi:glutaredoxin